MDKITLRNVSCGQVMSSQGSCQDSIKYKIE